MTEIWKNVAAFYQVSNLGNVRRLSHFGVRKDGVRYKKPGRLMSGSPDKDGYIQVRIEGRLMSVHRLVAAAFIGPCPVNMEVAHNNGVRSDCSADNLRYDTHAGNIQDQIAHGSRRRGVNAKLTVNQVIEVKKRLTDGESNASIARLFGVEPSMISNIKRGKIWSWL